MDAEIDVAAAPSGAGCAECDEAQGWWVHLRRCATCGHVGCCDTSPGQHATRHATTTGHRFMQSFEPGEDWYYDYVTEQVFDGPELAPPRSRPEDQPVPGPAGRVPPTGAATSTEPSSNRGLWWVESGVVVG
ncbi:UBP-type zinc finger domain-containing protein [Nocardioides sp. TF02-7]|uniref:UBP-type zinc finger domain-containing protein n=1 Tax=Nocardioides sp. TF02-7 TaxID=2917724 RepID=UPI001F06E627|nr:UBP-type zinc finger domain-containing protein [Nocardioides sp. TF02-7]UMG93951.1 UBP-type zinc finger domain-containing protein [Nocardioides sp. TF02-7]